MAESNEGHLKLQGTLRQNESERNLAVPAARTVLVRDCATQAVCDAHFIWITQLIQEVNILIYKRQHLFAYTWKHAMCMKLSCLQYGLCLVNVYFLISVIKYHCFRTAWQPKMKSSYSWLMTKCYWPRRKWCIVIKMKLVYNSKYMYTLF